MADGISAVFKVVPGPGIGSGGLSIGTFPGGGGLNATGKKFAFCGPVWFQERTGTKDIRRVGFRWSTVTKAGGSAMTVSLQNVSTSATPLQPDETQDQTVAIANADAAFVSNTWYRTGTFSADRTVAFGEMVAVVIEFDGAGRLGADTINVASRVSTVQGVTNSSSCFKSGGVWTCDLSCAVNMVLEFSDGTFGTMAGGFPCSAVGAISYNSGTLVADEYALEVKFTKDVRVDLASWAAKLASASADYEFLIYDGTTAVATVTIDGSWRNTTVTTIAISTPLPTPITLTAGTLYRFALRPTTANPIEVYYHDVADANHWVCHVGGPDWRLTSRLDQGAWAAATTTRRLYMQPHTIFEFAGGDPPAPDESWPCNIQEPIFFGVVKDAAANVYKFGPKPLRDASTYLGGYGDPRLLSVDDVSRQASDFLSGSFQVQQARMQAADTDYHFRNAPSTFSGQEAWIFAYSEAIRRAQGNPAIIFHGITYADNLTPNLTYEFNINDYLGITFNILNTDRMIPQRTATSADFNLVAGMQGRAIPIVGGVVARPGTDGAYKVPYLADLVIGGTTYMVGLIAGHACYSVDLFQNAAAVTYGTNVYAPGHTNWTTVSPSGDLFFDINSNRYCLILVDKASTEGIAWLDGTQPIYANISGMETSGDGHGTLITDLLTLYKYLMKYWFLQSYTSGAWPAGAQFEYFPGSGLFYDVMDDLSWDAASTQSAIYLGGGFVGGFILGASGRQISIRSAIAQCNVSCNVFMSVNATNQLFVNMFNTDRVTLLGSTRTISDRRDILASPRPPIVRKKEWFINSMGWQWEENYRQDSTGQWNSSNESSLGPSVANYGRSPGSRTYSLIRDSATADAVAGLQLTFGGTNPPGIITWAQSICGMGFGVLSAAPMAYFGGNGPAGWTYAGPAPVYILSQRFTPRTGIVTFTGMDVGAIAT